MTRTKLDKRFFGSTRGQIVTLLRGTTKTVNELTEELGLTDNAVRAHLLSLERDGLVRQAGIQRGTRKPHFAYELTEEAEHLFPKAYDILLKQLITVLKGKLPPAMIDEVLREVGRSLAVGQTVGSKNDDLESRIRKAVSTLESLGGAPRIEKEKETFLIRSESCPLAAVAAEHPEVCSLAETLLSEIIGVDVQERCDHEGSPHCAFEILEVALPG